MATNVTLPELGESVTEGTVTQWLKSVGDTVEVDEPLLEISTDKVDTEIPSPVAGTLLEIKADEDETVEVGAILAVIGDEGESGSDTGDDQAQSDDSTEAGDAAEEPAQDEPAPEAEAADEAPAQDSGTTDGDTDEDSAQDQEPPQADTSSSSDQASGDDVAITLPELGESVTEGTVTQWLKQPGDSIEVDEPLLEISTDKVDTEIPSPVAGTVTKILVDEDETVEVGAELAVISTGDGGGSAAPATDTSSTDSSGEAEAAPAEESSASEDTSEATSDDAPEAKPDDAPEARPDDSPEASDDSSPAEESSSSDDSEQSVDEAAEQKTDQVSDDAPDDPSPSDPAPAPAAQSSSSTASSSQSSSDQSSSGGTDTYVTPIVRKLAKQHGVDLATVTGSGVGGRIRKQDVLDAAESAGSQQTDDAPAPSPGAATPSRSGSAPAAASAEPSPLRGKTDKITRLRRTIATRMVDSLQTAAQLTQVHEVDVTEVARLRAKHKDAFAEREGVKLTYLPFFAKAAVEALKAYPIINSQIDLDEGTITYPSGEHLALAVDTERGLLAPTIRDAGDLSIAGLARKIADVAERTRTNKITPDELSGGTFSITNLGSNGALFDTPIINQPQAAILGVGAVVKRAVVISDPHVGESIAVRSMAYLALTYDHRVIDGADAGRFITAVKQRLEAGAFEAELGS